MTDVETRVRAMLDESGVPTDGDDALVGLLVALEARHVPDRPPPPGPELAASLAASRGPGRGTGAGGPVGRRRALTAGAVALGVVLATGVGAAANELPTALQRWVADLSERYLPFDLPRPPEPVPPATRPPVAETEDGGRDVDRPADEAGEAAPAGAPAVDEPSADEEEGPGRAPYEHREPEVDDERESRTEPETTTAPRAASRTEREDAVEEAAGTAEADDEPEETDAADDAVVDRVEPDEPEEPSDEGEEPEAPEDS